MTRHNLNVYFHYLKRQILQRRHVNLAWMSWYDFLQSDPYKDDITHEFYKLSGKHTIGMSKWICVSTERNDTETYWFQNSWQFLNSPVMQNIID
jgi:hypothetical protein